MTYVTHMERIAEKKGKLEGKLEVAENMLQNKCSIEDIMKYTGLSEKEIKAIKNRLK
jgi:predicted transposase/invertase (TIGR01784 family)